MTFRQVNILRDGAASSDAAGPVTHGAIPSILGLGAVGRVLGVGGETAAEAKASVQLLASTPDGRAGSTSMTLRCATASVGALASPDIPASAAAPASEAKPASEPLLEDKQPLAPDRADASASNSATLAQSRALLLIHDSSSCSTGRC